MKAVPALLAALVAAAPAVTHAGPDADDAATAAPTVIVLPPAARAADGNAAAVEVMPEPQLPALPPESARPPALAPESPRQIGRWYGWELMLSDTLFLLLASDKGHETGLGSYGLPLGLAGVALGAPALHFVHGNRHRAAVSLLIRGGATALGALAYHALDSDSGSSSTCTEHCAGVTIDEGELVLGALAVVAAGGAITYVITEYFRFSRVPVAVPARPSATLMPTATLRPGGGGLGLVGTF